MGRLPTYYTFTCLVCGVEQKTRRREQTTCGRPKPCAAIQANRTRDPVEKVESSRRGGLISGAEKRETAKSPDYWRGFQNGYRAGNRRNLDAVHILEALWGGQEGLTRERVRELRDRARRLLLHVRTKQQREEGAGE